MGMPRSTPETGRAFVILMAAASVMTIGTLAGAGEVPRSLAGFTLGRPIEEAADRVIMETALPVRYMENVQEVEIQAMEGFKSGLIAFGTCRKPNAIVRIKLKYADSGREFFESLLQRFKKKFGDPTEYQGDPFGVLISWKWSFSDASENRISLILQHNEQDEEEKIGNAVKFTLHNRLDEDARCFKENRTDGREKLRQRRAPGDPPGMTAWDMFVPK
jgi:hypothetical protein